MNDSNLKVVKNYIIGLCCIVIFYLLDNSNFISELQLKSDKLRDKGFGTFLLTGLIKYGLLFYGIIAIVIPSYFLIKEKISKDGKKN